MRRCRLSDFQSSVQRRVGVALGGLCACDRALPVVLGTLGLEPAQGFLGFGAFTPGAGQLVQQVPALIAFGRVPVAFLPGDGDERSERSAV